MMEGTIEYLKRGITANNKAIADYEKSIANAEGENALVRMERNAIEMLKRSNDETNEAIKILEEHRGQ